MPLLQMIALAVATASAGAPAETSMPAQEAPSIRCELTPETSVNRTGRIRETYLSQCPGLPASKLHVSYETAIPRASPPAKSR
jgi:hypothetical protein